MRGLAAFRTELPDLIGIKRGFPEIDIRIGIATAVSAEWNGVWSLVEK